ncbi:MAG: ATP-binding protein [Bacteroidia bacterium]|nr:ATP-binding protein [Bacteroidia bacterium]MDW8158750.1 ATP-binding protein [Bacteroidia bacterium]
MLDSIIISNYRNLKYLEINDLTRVNLIVGQNNIGKTAFLEAMLIYAERGSKDSIHEILVNRGEWTTEPENCSERVYRQIILKNYSGLFINRHLDFSGQNAILIGPKEYLDEQLVITPVKYVEKQVKDENGALYFTREEVSHESHGPFDVDYGLKVSFGTQSIIRPLFTQNNLQVAEPATSYFVGNSLTAELDDLWDNITLTDLENIVIEALQVIDNSIERLTFTGDEKGRKAIVKVRNLPYPVPLRSMGRGINRVLAIILSLVNASDGYLMIDEFEDSLHYSVQESLWQMIFYLAKRFNVQIFATTHSLDSIKSFEAALSCTEEEEAGKLIRLESKNNIITATCYNSENLNQAVTDLLEIR